MPRTARKAAGGVVYHVLNRGNGRQRLFHKPADYDAFVALLAGVKAAVPGVSLLAYCLMPNHWHLVLLPRRDGQLSRFMQRLATAHVRRHHAHYHADGAGGHLYQGRFKSFPVQDDAHLLTVLRYVESNPLRANPPLARKPGGWRWCSFAARAAGDPPPAGGDAPLLDEWPLEVPPDWDKLVAQPLADRERDALLARGGATPTPLLALRAASVDAVRKKPGRTEYQRGFVERAADGGLQVRVSGAQGSGILRSMSEANGLVVLGHEQGNVAAGDVVDVWMFDGLA
jgi:putative transposase